MLELGLFFALICALVTNVGYLLKHRGAVVAPAVDIRRPLASAVGLFRSRWFTIGWLVALVAWVFHVLALSLAPISDVRVVLAAGMVLLAVIADRMFGFKVGRRQWVALTAMSVGLGLLAVTRQPAEDAGLSHSTAAMMAFQGCLLGLGALLIAGPGLTGARAERRGLALGAASGVLFGVSDVALKELTSAFSLDGPLGVLSPSLLVAAIAAVGAFYASARALQNGEAVSVIAVTGTAANVVGIAGGMLVFGDPIPGDPVGIAVQAFAFVLIVVAGALIPAPLRAARATA